MFKQVILANLLCRRPWCRHQIRQVYVSINVVIRVLLPLGVWLCFLFELSRTLQSSSAVRVC